jgi:hypothetical protein
VTMMIIRVRCCTAYVTARDSGLEHDSNLPRRFRDKEAKRSVLELLWFKISPPSIFHSVKTIFCFLLNT